MFMQTICTKCKSILADGALSCPGCGTQVEEARQVYETIYCTHCGNKATTGFSACPECGEAIEADAPPLAPIAREIPGVPAPEADAESAQDILAPSIISGDEDYVKIKLKPPRKRTIIAAAIALVLIFTTVIILDIINKPTGNYLLYTKDKNLYYTSLPAFNPIPLGLDMGGYRQISVCDEGRYIFYPEYTADSSEAIFYWRDLHDKNADPVMIGGGIYYGLLKADGSKFIYQKLSDRALYIYDRLTREHGKISYNSADGFSVNDEFDYLLLFGAHVEYHYDEGNHIYTATTLMYEVILDGTEAKETLIDTGVPTWGSFYDANERKVYYVKDNTLYFKEYGKEKEIIASDVNEIVSAPGMSSLYFTRQKRVDIILSDLLHDDLLESDKLITEPEEPDWPNPPDSNDFMTAWESNMFGNEYNEERDERGYWVFNSSEYNAAYEEWWELNRGDGISLDEYKHRYIEYQRMLTRNAIRAELDKTENNIQSFENSLYYWQDGTETLVAENIWSAYYSWWGRNQYTVSHKKPIVIYNKNERSSELERVTMTNLMEMGRSGYSAREYIAVLRGGTTTITPGNEGDTVIAVGAKEFAIDAGNNAHSWSFHDDGRIFFIDWRNAGNRPLVSVTVTDDGVSAPVSIDENVDGYWLSHGMGEPFYVKSNDVYRGGRFISSGVSWNSPIYYCKDSDTLIFMNGSSLSKYSNNAITTIADNVRDYVVIDKNNIAYLTRDNNLMLYTAGKEPVLIERGVTHIYLNPKMQMGIVGGIHYWEQPPHF
jgi:hypothetical protein